MFISLFFSLLHRGRLRLSFLSFGRSTSTTVSPQPTTTAADAAERVISRDVDEVEVIPKRRRGRGIPPPPAGPRRGWESSDSVGLRVGWRVVHASRWLPPTLHHHVAGGSAVVDIRRYIQRVENRVRKTRGTLCVRASISSVPFSLSRSSTFLPSFPSFQSPLVIDGDST